MYLRLRTRSGDDVRLVFMQNPLGFHREAPLASQAALAAAEQGKFAEMHDLLLANQKALQRPKLTSYAQQIGLDVAAFESALDSGRLAAKVKSDQATAARLGASATPWFFPGSRERGSPRQSRGRPTECLACSRS